MIKPILNVAVLSVVAVLSMSVFPFSEPLPDDDFKIFLENQSYVSSIYSLQNTRLTQGHTQYEIWAGSYWPIHQTLSRRKI